MTETSNVPGLQDSENFLLTLTDPLDIIDGYPTEHGLRKLVEKYHGRIVGRCTEVHQTSSEFASVTVYIQLSSSDKDSITEFSGSADAHLNNTQGEYARYLLAMAETRATVRAYRYMLNIKTCSYEERDSLPSAEPQGKTVIDNLLENIAKKQDVNLASICKEKFNKDIRQLTMQEKQQLIKELTPNVSV